MENKPTLDWKSGHDPRSLEFNFYGAVDERELKPVQKKFWDHGVITNQGKEGACTGHGWTSELTASPMPYTENVLGKTNKFAFRLYEMARKHDRSLGWNFPSGATVIGGAKSVRQLGFIKEFRWCLKIEELRDAVINEGPVVIGIPWLQGMYDTAPSGLVDVSGREVGGHCLTVIGYHPNMRIPKEDTSKRFEVFKWVNSWGPDYGVKGAGYIRIEDLEKLLKNKGEACIPMGRKRVKDLVL